MNTRFLALLWILICGFTLEVLAAPEGEVVLHALGQGNSVVITASKDPDPHQPKKKVAVVVDSGNSELKYAASRYDKMGEGSGKIFSLTPTHSSTVLKLSAEEDPDAKPLTEDDEEPLAMDLDEEGRKRSSTNADTRELELEERRSPKKSSSCGI